MHGFPLKPAKTVPAAGWRKSNFGHKKRHRPSDDSIFRIKNGAGDRNRTGTGITPRGILSPLRLPVPPPRQKVEATPRIELGIKVLQTSALPLGYVANNLERKTRFELATPTLAR